MPSIPHSLAMALWTYAPPLAAFAAAVAVALVARGRAWAPAAGGLALFVGWALLLPSAGLPRVVWAPHRGADLLLAPVLACAVALGASGARRPRLVATGLAAFAGWWVARGAVGPAEFWRVWVIVAALAAAVARAVRGRAERSAVVAGSLWGGLAVTGAAAGLALPALVAAAAALGLAAAAPGSALPSAALAALLVATDLAAGRALRGQFNLVDLACALALAAPFAADAVDRRIGRSAGRFSTIVSSAAGCAAAVAIIWLARRASLT